LEARIVRRDRSGRGFLAGVGIGSSLLLAAAGRAQEARPPARAERNAVSYVLDRMHDAQASSVILDSAPPRLRLDLDSLPPETTRDGGRERVFALDSPVARGPAFGPEPPQLRIGGEPAPAPARVELIPARVEVMFKDHSAFRDKQFKRANDAKGNRFVVFQEPTEASFEVDLPRLPFRLVLMARNHGTKSECEGAVDGPPLVTVHAEGRELGSFELLPLIVAHSFDLPVSEGKTRITLSISRVLPTRGRIAALRSFALEAVDGRDRLRVHAPVDARGLAVEYYAMPPPPVQELFSTGIVRKPLLEHTAEVKLLPGRVGVVTGEPQPFEVLLDGRPVAASRERVHDLLFDLDPGTFGRHSITLRSATGLRGTYWLIQPRAFYLALHDPVAALSEPTPFVRGLDVKPGHALLRHFMLFGDTRRSLLAPAGSEVSFPVKIEAGDELRFSVGAAWLSDVMLPRGALAFDVELLTPDGGRHRLDSHELPKRRRTRWEERAAQPPPGFQGDARLLFRTYVNGRSPLATSDGMVAFGEPTLVRPRGVRRPNVLIYLIDTLRADHCTPWGYPRETTPRLDELAGEGIVFERAYSQAPWTRPSVATLFSSMLHTFHNASKTTGLAPQIVTLAECARESGYATAGFIANAHVHGSSLNFEQGFSRFEAIEKSKRRAGSRADAVNEAAFDWLQSHAGQPFFLYLHTIDPHATYDPPESTRGTWSAGYDGEITPRETGARALTHRGESARRKGLPFPPADLQHVIDLYDEEILANDREFAALCARLKELELWDDTIVVVLSDHGEEFGEHGGFGHGTRMWEELLRVPLIVKPDRRDGDAIGTRVAEQVRVMDVMPTLLDRMGLGAEGSLLMGTSLAEALRGGPVPALPVLAEEYPDRRALITTDRKKWISYGPKCLTPRAWVFDLEKDPFERNDLAETVTGAAERLRREFEAHCAEYVSRGFQRVAAVQQHLGEEDLKRLGQLGYANAAEEEEEGGATDAAIEDLPPEEEPEPADGE